ncbi:MAG TPA: hypothetical protein VGH76_04195 [Actinomycetospora sp.]|uniref:lytic transglycosylase domain-containing protein n=1 Tax=Actinomycetospora sp. TaxID=1872135 RepID=UPI002F41E57B
MSASVDSLRGAPEPSDDGEATDRFRAPTPDDATDRFRSPVAGDEPAVPEDGSGSDEATTTDDAASVDAAPPAESPPGTSQGAGAPGAGSQGAGSQGAESQGAGRSRRLSRGLRVPAASTSGGTGPTTGERAGSAPAPSATAASSSRPAPVAAALATAPPLGARPPTAGPPPPLPVGGPPVPSPSSSPTPPRRTAALGRLALVVVLVAAVIGTIVVLANGTEFGRTDAGPEEIPALEVAPAQVDLGTVGQPTALAPPSALLPGTNTTGSGGQGATSVSSWADDLGPRTNIPPVALQAYGMAELTMRRADPQCHLSWVTVAGLARIESNHGRYRGAHIEPNGDIEPRIVGVPLDGTSGNRTISDTDGGLLDGDPTLDRAVGPLQFIPSTWAKWRADGNGDGRADPDNIFDAALAAGRYLCADGRNLASGEGWRSAVLSYNNSDDYGRRVYAAAQAYANSTAP